jgi:hypothetical protein
MIRYIVHWTPEAEQRLVQYWRESKEFGVITSAMVDLERRISSEPRRPEATEREQLWFLDSGPLRVAYEIDDLTMTALIVNVGLLHRRR